MLKNVRVVGPFTETKMPEVVWKVSERGRGRDQDFCLLQQDAQV